MAEINSETNVEVVINPFTSVCVNCSNNLGKVNRVLEQNQMLLCDIEKHTESTNKLKLNE